MMLTLMKLVHLIFPCQSIRLSLLCDWSFATDLAEISWGDIPLIMNQLGHTQADISLLYINSTREKQRKVAEMLGKRRKDK